MGLVNKRIRFEISGLRVVIRRMSINIGLYKRFGVVVILRGLRRKRRGTNVLIDNYYYIQERGSLEMVHRTSERSNGKRRTELSEYKVFIGISSTGDASREDPYFPIVGVVSSILIEKDGETWNDIIRTGATDPSFTPEIPR